MKPISLVLLLGLSAAASLAQVPETSPAQMDDLAERARIRQQREVVHARVAQAERDCYQRFAVNDCLIAVRAARRSELAELKRQEVALDDARRRTRAAEQLLRSDDKAAARP